MENNKQNKTWKKLLLYLLLAIVGIIVGIVIYEIATVHNKYYIGEKNLKIPVLVYHEIVDDISMVKEDNMQTPVDVFEKQIIGLIKLGYTPISYEDLVQYKEGKIAIPKRSFLITFDDGYKGVYEYAYEIAKKQNIPMTLFIINDCVSAEGYVTWEQAKEMHDSGLMSIYSHGLAHIQYDKVSTEELVQKTNAAYKILREKLEDENILKVFTYPYGLYTEEGIEALKQEGYLQNLTDGKINRSNKLDLNRIHRIYPLNDPVWKIILKIEYKSIKYKN